MNEGSIMEGRRVAVLAGPYKAFLPTMEAAPRSVLSAPGVSALHADVATGDAASGQTGAPDFVTIERGEVGCVVGFRGIHLAIVVFETDSGSATAEILLSNLRSA